MLHQLTSSAADAGSAHLIPRSNPRGLHGNAIRVARGALDAKRKETPVMMRTRLTAMVALTVAIGASATAPLSTHLAPVVWAETMPGPPATPKAAEGVQARVRARAFEALQNLAAPHLAAAPAAREPVTITVPGSVLDALLGPAVKIRLWKSGRRRLEGRSVSSTDATLTVAYDGAIAHVVLQVPQVRVRGKYIKTRIRGRTSKIRNVRIDLRDIEAAASFNLCRPVTLSRFGGVTIRRVVVEGTGIVELVEGRVADKVRPIAIEKLEVFVRRHAASLIEQLLGDGERPGCSVPPPNGECTELGARLNAEADAVSSELTAALSREIPLDDERSVIIGPVSDFIALDTCTVKAVIGVEIDADEEDPATGTAVLTGKVAPGSAGNTVCLSSWAVSSALGAFTQADGEAAVALTNETLPAEPICVTLASVTTTTTTTPSRPTTTTTMPPKPPADACLLAGPAVAEQTSAYVQALRSALGDIEIPYRTGGLFHRSTLEARVATLTVGENCAARVTLALRARSIFRILVQGTALVDAGAEFDPTTGRLCLANPGVTSVTGRFLSPITADRVRTDLQARLPSRLCVEPMPAAP